MGDIPPFNHAPDEIRNSMFVPMMKKLSWGA